MNDEHADLEAQLAQRAGAAPPPPPELRARVLAAVKDELAAEPVRRQAFWVGYAMAAAALLLALNMAMVAGESSAGFTRQPPTGDSTDARFAQPTMWSVRQGMLPSADEFNPHRNTPRRQTS